MFFAGTLSSGPDTPSTRNPTELSKKPNRMKRSQSKSHSASRHNLSRREFLTTAGKGLGLTTLFGGVPQGWVGSAYASDGPETTKMRFGMIALTDCSPIVIAHEKGLFKKYGIESTVAKGANWAAIRDSLSSGDNQGTHMLIGMPIASTMGLLGSPKKPMIIPWLLNRNGQAISLANKFKGKGQTPKQSNRSRRKPKASASRSPSP